MRLALVSMACLLLSPAALSWAQDDRSTRAAAEQEIDQLVGQAIEAGDLPGAVVALRRGNEWVFRKCYGKRFVEPKSEPMTEDTIFDMASITKPVSTATSIWLLVQEGKIDIEAPVKNYLPDFTGDGRDAVLVRHLLTHSAGLIPDNSIEDYKHGPDEAWRRLMKMEIKSAPGSKFVYSDVGFLLLGKIVETVSGMPLDRFTRERIFQPLGMQDSGYVPAASLRDRIAPTEPQDGVMIHGTVHDPRAALLGGTAGHAGLFSTLDDLSKYADMLLHGGRAGDRVLLRPETIWNMTRHRPVEHRQDVGMIYRTAGWDAQSPFSYNGGRRLSPTAFGHGGFTGTVFWIDPDNDLFFVFLSNRLHPDGKGNVNQLAGKIATRIVQSLPDVPDRPVDVASRWREHSVVLTGLDAAARQSFRSLKGKRVGIVTNQTGIDRSGKTVMELLAAAPDVKLTALFSPEHGIEGKLDVNKISDSRDSNWNVPIYSLYGESRKPKPEQLAEIDVLVYDIQDIGTRFYTYIATMKNCLRACSEQGKEFVVFDRPNPLGGRIDGFNRDGDRESFVACHNIPLQHGMTVGELALLFNQEEKLNGSLTVVPVRNWTRSLRGYETGLEWINPSPNMRTVEAAFLYPGIGMLEMTNISVGRGTDRPFQWIGAPWMDGSALAEHINSADVPGVKAIPRKNRPDASKYSGEVCSGVQLVVTDTTKFTSVRLGLTIADGLRKLHPDAWQSEKLDVLLVNKLVTEKIRGGANYGDLARQLEQTAADFASRRRSVALYDE